jgi:hypothetical protein
MVSDVVRGSGTYMRGNPTLKGAAATWPTPDATVSNDGEEPETFLIRQEILRARGINGNGMGTPLAMAAKLWPTPDTMDGPHGARGVSSNKDHQSANSLDAAAKQWPTPAARDWRSDSSQMTSEELYGTKGRPLSRVAMEWSTPSVADTTGGRMNRSGPRSAEQLLKGQANTLMDQWMTPRVASGAYTRDSGDPDKERLTLEGQASFHQVHPTYPVGGVSSQPRRSLNPLFVEWLMGWPPGWTLLAWTDFACSATALCRYRQRMRSALWQLGLPPTAAPQQISLFGE